MRIEYEVLEDDVYEKKLNDARKLIDLKDDQEKDKFRIKVGVLQDNISNALAKKWDEDDNWAVTYDYNYQYYTCGAVYSDATFSKEYILEVLEAINLQDSPSKWAYHTACEILVNPSGKTFKDCVETRGDFFVKNNIVYLKKSMLKKHREKLGCEF